MMTLDEFRIFTSTAEPGARCMYHSGALDTFRDRLEKTPKKKRTPTAKALVAVADMAYNLAVGGHGHLSQRRGGGEFEYWYEVVRRRN